MFNIAVITDPIECLLKETDTTLGIINILQKNNKIRKHERSKNECRPYASSVTV